MVAACLVHRPLDFFFRVLDEFFFFAGAAIGLITERLQSRLERTKSLGFKAELAEAFALPLSGREVALVVGVRVKSVGAKLSGVDRDFLVRDLYCRAGAKACRQQGRRNG